MIAYESYTNNYAHMRVIGARQTCAAIATNDCNGNSNGNADNNNINNNVENDDDDDNDVESDNEGDICIIATIIDWYCQTPKRQTAR